MKAGLLLSSECFDKLGELDPGLGIAFMPGKRNCSDLSRHIGYNVTISQQVSFCCCLLSVAYWPFQVTGWMSVLG